MWTQTLIRWSGMALILGGISLALFLLLHPYGVVAGAETAARASWIPSHSYHFLGALLTLLGLVGLYAREATDVGRFGVVGFVVAFVGTAMFVGTGMTTAFFWPVIAQHAPGFVAADGPMFTAPLAIGTTAATYVFLMVGYLLFGIALLRARNFSPVGPLLLIVGVVLFSVPVQPVGPIPWIVRVAGAVIFGSGLATLGHVLWSESVATEHA